jgi:putative methanogenesis marker protein 3
MITGGFVVSIEINEQKLDMKDGATLKDAIEVSKAVHYPGSTVGILKTGAKKEEATSEFRILTTKGEFRIELTGDTTLWAKFGLKFQSSKAHWETNNSIAFGPVETDVIPQRAEQKYNRYDVIFNTGGYDPKNTYLMFSKEKHISDYGSPKDAIIGKVISGKKTIMLLKPGDMITEIEPVIKWETLLDKASTADLDTRIEDGMKIFTYFKVDLVDEAPEGAEHFLGIMSKNIFRVDSFSNTFISNDTLKGEGCPYEHWDARSEGSVATRTDGLGNGRIYIYKEDRTSSAVHSILGHITKGIELIKVAQTGNKLSVVSNPEWIMILGKTFAEAEEILHKRGLELEKRGYTGDDAIIVEQDPDTTIEIIKTGMVSALGVRSEKIINVSFYDDLAPQSLDFFRHSLRLKVRPIGPLPLVYTYENSYFFRSEKEAETYKELNPENVPRTSVKAGEIGVTNQASKRYGMIGVRLTDDDKYGPTSEKFECTNIIGRVLEPQRLKGLKEGDTIYMREV